MGGVDHPMLEAIDRSADPTLSRMLDAGLHAGRKLQLLMTSTSMLVIIATYGLWVHLSSIVALAYL
jgi:hypothetical protein